MILAALTPLLVLSLFALPAKAQTASPSAKLKLPPYQKTKLPNGLTILLMEKHNLPLVSFSMDVKSGSTSDPAGQEGTASLAAALLRKGTKTRSAEQFSNDLDFIGGSFNAGASTDFTFISAEFMKKDLAKGLDLLSDPILNPTFPPDEFTKLVAQRKDGIRAAKDQAQGVLGTYFNAYLMGGHPYARPTNGDELSLAQITRDAVAKFYATYYKPGNAILSVVGDFDSAEMEKALATQFGGWANATVPAVQLSAATPAQGKRLLLVDKPDSTQTYFRIGNLGIARTSPDRVYVNVVNTLFGGRFTSMINSALRIQSGLTYGANSVSHHRSEVPARRGWRHPLLCRRLHVPGWIDAGHRGQHRSRSGAHRRQHQRRHCHGFAHRLPQRRCPRIERRWLGVLHDERRRRRGRLRDGHHRGEFAAAVQFRHFGWQLECVPKRNEHQHRHWHRYAAGRARCERQRECDGDNRSDGHDGDRIHSKLPLATEEMR